jgi:DNA ligase D-like protein (predicted 3'-phosphoesterase)
MVLEKYKQKRNFTSTPEPSGDVKLAQDRAKKQKPAEGLFFCVQKHLASHLHYDFRLEYKGVLLSWAVPKGPSLDPKTKRLAMHVEDHPIEYGTFEGVIPSGYGAGIVMLWDQGTWKPESEDVDAALKKGDLKFTLDGYKLKGSWVLVRTGGRWGGSPSTSLRAGPSTSLRAGPSTSLRAGRSTGGDARSWLLIKHRDDWAGELDITEFAPRSVKSDGDFEDILAADKPDIWESHRPAEGGEAGAMLKKIIERAALLRQGGRAGEQADGQAGGQTAKAGARGKAAPKARKAAPRQKATKKATAPRKRPTTKKSTL